METATTTVSNVDVRKYQKLSILEEHFLESGELQQRKVYSREHSVSSMLEVQFQLDSHLPWSNEIILMKYEIDRDGNIYNISIKGEKIVKAKHLGTWIDGRRVR